MIGLRRPFTLNCLEMCIPANNEYVLNCKQQWQQNWLHVAQFEVDLSENLIQ